jgi:hypothetical protein
MPADMRAIHFTPQHHALLFAWLARETLQATLDTFTQRFGEPAAQRLLAYSQTDFDHATLPTEKIP